MKLTGFEVYQLFNAIRLHFTTESYDYFMYGGKTNTIRSKFEARKDRFSFNKLSNLYDGDRLKEIFAANFYYTPDMWITEFVNDRKGCIENTVRVFSRDEEGMNLVLANWLRKNKLTKELFEIKDGQNPKILTMLYNNEIFPETFIALDSVLEFTKTWNDRLDDKVLWPKRSMLLNKLKPFIWKKEYRENVKNIIINS